MAGSEHLPFLNKAFLGVSTGIHKLAFTSECTPVPLVEIKSFLIADLWPPTCRCQNGIGCLSFGRRNFCEGYGGGSWKDLGVDLPIMQVRPCEENYWIRSSLD